MSVSCNYLLPHNVLYIMCYMKKYFLPSLLNFLSNNCYGESTILVLRHYEFCKALSYPFSHTKITLAFPPIAGPVACSFNFLHSCKCGNHCSNVDGATVFCLPVSMISHAIKHTWDGTSDVAAATSAFEPLVKGFWRCCSFLQDSNLGKKDQDC